MVLRNFQCQGVLLILIIVGLGPTCSQQVQVWGCLDISFSHVGIFFLSLPFSEMAQYRLKYCLKGLFNPQQSIPLICSTECFTQP